MATLPARYPGATWYGSPNDSPGGMIAHKGVVLHIEQGSESGTISWFQNPKSQVSAHFAVGKDGAVAQFVNLGDKAWAEVNGNNSWISVENEGNSGDNLTIAQITAIGKLCAWLVAYGAFSLQLANSPSDSGLGYHAMGGASWGGHYDCPGAPIIAQRSAILQYAGTILHPSKPPIISHPPLPVIPAFPLPKGWYFGPLSGPTQSVSNLHAPVNPAYLNGLMLWQRRMQARGWTISVDGKFGDQTASVAAAFQAEKHLAVSRVVDANTWISAWATPVT